MSASLQATFLPSEHGAGEARPGLVPPREHQVQALAAVREARARGVRRQLLSIPTGGGKTYVAAHVILEAAMPSTVFLVHRDELVTQTVAAIRRNSPWLSVGVVKAERDEVWADVIVASVQTLAHRKRLERLLTQLARPRLLIVDEAHHAVSNSYRQVIDGIDADLTLGLTATAYRADKKALGGIFEEIVYHLPMLPLIAAGKLANLVGLRIDTTADLDAVHTVAGEFNEDELSTAVDTESRNQLVVDSWHEHAHLQGRTRSVAFCVTTSHATHLRDCFRANGVDAEVILGETPTWERERIYQRFRDGDLPVLTSVMVLSEGWDEPRADCGLMTRPTKSLGLYVQLAGRLARAYPGKPDALIVDFVDVTSRHSLITLPTLAGREAAQSDDDEADEQATKDGRANAEQRSLLDMAADIAKVKKLRAAWVDLFGASPYVWQQAAGHWMTPTEDGWLTLKPEGEGFIPLKIATPVRGLVQTTRLFTEPVDAETARGIAESMVPKSPLTDREARWRDRPPSDAQRNFARKLGLQVPRDATKGQLSAAIDAALFAQNLKRAGGL